MQRRRLLQSLSVLSVATLPHAVLAQSKDAPIKILCGFAPGGLTDVVSRLFAEKLRMELGQTVIVENKPGAAGRLATQALKAAAPDGRTLMIAPNSGPIFLEVLYPKSALGYDLLNDLTPVGTMTTYPFGMVVQRSLGVKNIQEYVAWAKANPKDAVYGNAGAGGHGHFVGTKLSQAIGVPLLSIPYKGNGPVNIDLLGAQLPAAILPASDLMQHRNNPKLQILGLFEKTRSPLVPEVPTMAEQGLTVEVGQAWMGMWTSAKVPKAEIEKIQNALRKVLADPSFKETLMTKFTMFPMFHTAAETDALQRNEIELWRPIIKASGFTPNQ